MAKLIRALAVLIIAGVGVGGHIQPAAAGDPITVVELYISQGCNSCPPADAMLGELAKRDDMLPIKDLKMGGLIDDARLALAE